MKNYDIAIVGGGAAAFSAAIAARSINPQKSVLILERMPRVLKKVLATGNGTCNLSNKNISSKNYHGEGRSIFDGIYHGFDLESTVSFFKSIGIKIIQGEEGKLYPMSRSAASVVDALRFKAEALGCDTICDFNVTEVRKESDLFLIKSENGKVYARAAIIAAGGCAQKNLGSNGSGFDILKSFGHEKSKLFPAICPYKTEKEKIRPLRGIRINCKISVTAGNNILHCGEGELLFTEYGLSGPVIFRAARCISENLSRSPLINIDLLPEIEKRELEHLLLDFCNDIGYLPSGNILCGLLPKALSSAVVKDAGVSVGSKIERLTDRDIRAVANSAKSFTVKPTEPMGFDKAQVTAGGISTKQFDPLTLESLICKNLFAAGEVLDIDGDCGGYNLQWAWSSGFTAGKSAAEKE